MAQHSFNPLKRFMTDLAGVGLIILSVLLGWIPGPGGIPLFIAGLSLLSINHGWAKRWLKKAKEGGLSFSERIFADHPVAKWTLDIIGVAMMILAIFILNNYTRNVARSLAISAGLGGLGLFLGNRKRLQRFINFIRRKG